MQIAACLALFLLLAAPVAAWLSVGAHTGGKRLSLQQARGRGAGLVGRTWAWDPALDSEDSSGIETGSSSRLLEKKRAETLAKEAEEAKARDALLRKSRVLFETIAKESTASKASAKSASVAGSVFAALTPAAAAKPPTVVPAAAASSSAVAPAASPSTGGGISSAQGFAGQTFDAGLIIAFPVIVGTLALFFIFPLIKDQLGASLPPVPMGP